jgi:hypothetical protein
MSERIELSLSVTEVQLATTQVASTFKCDVRVADCTLELSCPAPPKNIYLSASASTPLSLKLVADGFLVGGAVTSLGALFPDRLSGIVEAWVKLTASHLSATDLKLRSLYPDIDEAGTSKLKLHVSIRPVSRSPTPSSYNYKVRCPYLERISQSQESDMKKLEAVQQARKLIGSPLDVTADSDKATLSSWMNEEVEDIDVSAIDLDNISSQDAEYLKAVVIGLAHKLKGVTKDLEELELMREQIQSSSQARADLQVSIEETTAQFIQETGKLTDYNQALQVERNLAKAEVAQQRTDNEELETQNERLLCQVAKLTQENLALQAKEALFNELQSKLEHDKTEVEARERLQLTAETQLKETLEKLQSTVTDQVAEISELQTQLTKAQEAKVALQSELNSLKAEVIISQVKIQTSDCLDNRCRYLEEALNTQTKSREALQQKLLILSEDIKAQSTQSVLQLDRLQQEKTKLQETLKIVEGELELSEEKLNEAKVKLSEQTSQLASLEQIFCVREDSHQLYEETIKQRDRYKKAVDQITKELSYLSNYVVITASRARDDTVFIRQITEAYEDKQFQVEALKLMLSKETSMGGYVPVRGDPVDEALALWYNSRSQSLPAMFSRQEAEVYQFGSKRVGLRLEGASLVVRAGTSSLSIEKFVELNAGSEARPSHSLLKDKDQVSPTKAVRHLKINENSPVSTFQRKPTLASPRTRY